LELCGEVRIPRTLWVRLGEVLLTDRVVETKCFMLCRALELPGRTLFLVRELIEFHPMAMRSARPTAW
jgi:hypothetical protein